MTWVAPREEPKPATQEMICIMRARKESHGMRPAAVAPRRPLGPTGLCGWHGAVQQWQ